jgi:anti-sigma factor RsiW
MNEIETIQKLDAAMGEGAPVDVTQRVMREIRAGARAAQTPRPMWIAAVVSAVAAAAVLVVAAQTFSGLQDPMGDLLTPVMTALQ